MDDRAEQFSYESVNFAKLGRYAEALNSVDKVIAISPDDASAWAHRGQLLYELGRYAESLNSSDKALAIRPDDGVAWSFRGKTLYTLGRFEEALNSVDKGIAIGPVFAYALGVRGSALSQLGRDAEAIDSMDKGIAIRPDDGAAWSNRGSVLIKLGRYAEAVDSFDKAITISPDSAPSWLGRGFVLNQLGRYAEAVDSFDKMIAIKPDYPDPWLHRGDALIELGRYAEAVDSFDKAIAIKPDYVDAWYTRGSALKQLGRDAEAIDSYDQVLQLNPQNKNALAQKNELLNRIHNEQQKNRQNANRRTLTQQPQVIRAYEFYAGYIRLKISVKNLTPLTIHDVILEPDIDRVILYLERHEPEEYPLENERIILGNINPNNDRTVSLYLEPTICAKEGTDVQCHVRYKDAQGKPGSLYMEPLRIQVVCPIFETKESVNIGSLKQLIETLPSRDSKILSVPRNLDAPTQLKIFQSVIQLHDIRYISTLRRPNISVSWYYGKTKVTQKDMVIKLGIVKDMDMVEITAFSHDPKDLTGLIAEISRHVTKEFSKMGNVQKIFNVTIKDSVLTRTNLLNNCDTDGKCSEDVTIVDSVVTGSNIA